MFFLSYMFAELRRRRSRTILTALGLGVGVALVVAVSALSTGLADAQKRVLQPLTGIGTDMSVTRPIKFSSSGGAFGSLSRQQQKRLRSQSRPGAGFGFSGAKPGSKINTDVANSPQVAFSHDRVAKLASLGEVAGAAGYLTLDVNHISGTVPKVRINQSGGGGGFASPGSGGSSNGGGGSFGGFGRGKIKFSSRTVTGVDGTQPSLAPLTPSQIVNGHYFSAAGGRYQAVVSQSYANSNSIKVGQQLTLFSKKFTVVGISKAPLGATASNIYVELPTLQTLSGYSGEVNGVNVRAADGGAVTSVSKEIRTAFRGASVTTASDLAKRVGGSLTDARNLSSKLGRALEIVALAAAVLIACLLTLASVARRVREIGTLKAVGWTQWAVTRQISGEAVLQGVLGGLVGALGGAAAVWAINASGWTLKASVAGVSGSTAGQPGPGGFGFGGVRRAANGGGSELVHITTSVDPRLLVAAVALAALGGLVAGAAGGLRAARLRPAAALRNIE